jgi:regulatory protein
MEDRPRKSREASGVDVVRARLPLEKAMGAALKILAARSCSEGELREKLMAKGWAEPVVLDTCIERLKDLNYVNDDAFAHSYARYRVSLKPLGRARVSRELIARKVSRNRIDKALDLVFGEFAEESLLDQAIERRIRTHGRPGDRAAAKRMFDHLARLGFEYDLISRKLREVKSQGCEIKIDVD